jgi:hypothetical protein
MLIELSNPAGAMNSPIEARPHLVCALWICALSVIVACYSCAPDASTDVDVPVPTAPADGAAEPPTAEPVQADAAAAQQDSDPAKSTETPADELREETIADIKFKVPADWKRVELTPQQQGFIDARFLIPAGDAEVQLTCSSTGGGRQANIDRWIGQFRLPEGEKPQTETLRIDGAEATWVDLSGTFDSRMPGSGGPQENWRMLGVAIAADGQDFYLKLTGPQAAVAEVHDDFRAFAKSANLP